MSIRTHVHAVVWNVPRRVVRQFERVIAHRDEFCLIGKRHAQVL